jgi:hypothetical protein
MIAGAAVAALAAGAGASAPVAANPIPKASSYADLFEPVPDAIIRLQASDAQHAATFQEAQYNGNQYNRGYDRRDDRGYDRGRDHHHHHSNYRSRRWYQSHGYSYYGGRWQIRPRHHHHHHHNNY